jgi:hypothetical protein
MELRGNWEWIARWLVAEEEDECNKNLFAAIEVILIVHCSKAMQDLRGG